MSGTPIVNDCLELYPYLDFIREPAAVGGFELFKRNFGKDDGPDGNKRLVAILRKTMCRRTHSDTLFGSKLLDLPQPKQAIHWCSFNEIERKVRSANTKRTSTVTNMLIAFASM